MTRLRGLSDSSNPEIAKMAIALLQIAAIAPFRRRRAAIIRRKAPHLLRSFVELVEPEDLPEMIDEEPLDFHLIDEWEMTEW